MVNTRWANVDNPPPSEYHQNKAMVRLDVPKTPTPGTAMSIWNKILLGLIFVSALGLFVTAALTLHTHQSWREEAQGLEQRMEELDEEIVETIEAVSEDNVIRAMGIEQLRQRLFAILIDRGRVWTNCEPEQINAETGAVRVRTDFPDEDNLPGRHGIHEGTILYVFEEDDVEAPLNEAGGRYLGEFKVTEVADRLAGMEPAMRMDARELERLAESRGPWSLYEVLPHDSHKIVRDMDKDYLRQVLPENVANEYLFDGERMTRAKADELGLEGRIVDEEGEDVADGEEGAYVRDLRDYGTLFAAYHRERTLWYDRQAAAESDKEFAEVSAAQAARQVEFRQAEGAKLQGDLEQLRREVGAVVGHEKALDKKLAELGQSIAELAANNRKLASEIVQVQLEAQQRIDERTRRVAAGAAEQ